MVTEDWYFVSHRLPLAVAALRQGYDVAVVTRASNSRSVIEQAGVRVIPFSTNRRGLSPLELLREAWSLARIYRRERPDLVHHVALRTIIVGGLAARLAGQRRVISAIAGMGFLFTAENRTPIIRQIVARVLPWAMSRGVVIVQNTDDARLLVDLGVSARLVHLVPGAGVDTVKFSPRAEGSPPMIVMMAGRLLWDKGLAEFVEAAKILRNEGAKFILVGMIDSENPAAASESRVRAWVDEGVLEWWGHRDDMSETLSKADIFCLPSYREGLPKAILEAMASGKACVTTDVPGCRDAVRHGDNGILVPAHDSAALARGIGALLADADKRKAMGRRGRERALQEFSEGTVIQLTLNLYRKILAGTPARD